MSATVTRIAIVGARGRLGTRITALAAPREDVSVVATLGRTDADPEGGVDVVIDVSGAAGAARAIALADRLGAPLLQASTGLAARDQADAEALATRVAVLHAPNLSPGVTMLHHLVREAVARLPEGWTIEIVEAHHAGKVDAPSGTALALAASAGAGGRAVSPERIRSVRDGEIIGEHELILTGPMETVRLRHEAGSRDLFAVGGIEAARWLHGRPPGRYRMDDVLAGT